MKRCFQLVALPAIVLLGSYTGGEDKGAAEKTEEKPKVKLADITARLVEWIQEYTATVETEVKNNIAPSSPVRIDKISVEVGDHVSQGRRLVRMDAANLKQTKLRLDSQEMESKRTDELYKVGGTSKSEWDTAKMTYDVEKTAYQNLLGNTSLLNPISGVATARNYDSGDMYNGGNPVLIVEKITPVKLLINVSEVYFTKVREGTPVDMKPDVYDDEAFEGRIDLIYLTIDPVTRTFRVGVQLPNQNQKVRPGMFARASLNSGTGGSMVVPDPAIARQVSADDRYVYVCKDEKVTYSKVKLGCCMGTEYELKSDIPNNSQIVIAGQTRLISGTEVEVEK